MHIILNHVEYTAPMPVTGLWFAIEKLKTEQERRVLEITSMWNEIKAFEGRTDLDEAAAEKLEQAMVALSKKTEENKRMILEAKIKIIIQAFKNPHVTQETIMEFLPLQAVAQEYGKIASWLNDIVIGRTVELPKEKTLTV